MAISAAELARIDSFPKLIDVLRDHLEWPIGEDYGFDEVVFEYEARELGLKPEETAKIREIHQLRPLARNQPWGIFFISFEDKTLSVTVLRRILRSLVVKKRAGSQPSDRQAWDKSDLIFAANFGRSGDRELAFVHFSDGAASNDLPVMKVLGWNAKDTGLHNDYVGQTLTSKLRWPEDQQDSDRWRKDWSDAFELRLNETIRTAKDLAVRLAALASEIRARVNELLGAETDAGQMRTMLAAFRKNLIQDLDDDGFADMFAQTIAYGMLAARISRPGGLLVADNLADMVPKTNPFLKELFESFLKLGGRDKRQGMDFDELGVRDVVDMLNNAKMEAVLRDFGDRNPKEDPVIHFYELFLKEYDPQKRMQRGVFYTPRPVVNFIVRGVDEILSTEFGLPLGLADTSTWAEVAARSDRITIPAHVKPDAPFVQILDPATGTGTFLVEVIDQIHKRMDEHWKAQGKTAAEIKAAWNAYVPAHLLPRLTAFELMMAPYTIAHMKVGLKLLETGYAFGSEERARIFLTNALEPPRDLDMEFVFMSEALAHEAQASNDAKARTAFTIIVGNPPYASLSANLTSELRRIVDPYRSVDGVKIRERNMLQFEKNIQDDYVKFIRLAEREASKNYGVISLITNHGYIDAPTLRGLRWHLWNSFSSIEVIDLHGNSNKKESLSSGNLDKNIFPIKQGVAVLRARHATDVPAVAWGELWGEGRDKEERLYAGSWREFVIRKGRPSAPDYLFAPLSTGPLEAEWVAGGAVNVIFPLFSTGVESGFDDLLLDFDIPSLLGKLEAFDGMGREEAIEAFDAKKGNARKIIDERTKVLPLAKDISLFQKHAFDFRVLLATKRLLKTNSENIFANIDNFHPGLVTTRQTKEDFGSLAVAGRCGHKLTTSYDRVSVFPLWLKPSVGEPQRRPNIDRAWALVFGEIAGLTYEDGIPRGEQKSFGPDFERPKAEQIGLLDTPWDGRGDGQKTFGPRDLFEYIYAVLQAPSYRSRYAEFLKAGFPRIPAPATRAAFAALASLGRQLIGLHLLRPEDAPVLMSPDIRLAGSGDARVEKGYPEYKNGKVMINASRWFEDVPKATWDFHVGGYQVCEKWLRDRAGKGGKNPSFGRVLTDEDILHYRRVAVALTETRRLMDEIDAVIDRHGGWPNAFYVPPPPPPTIEQIIKADEGQELEYKSTLQFDLKEATKSKLVRKATLKTIVAFLNSGKGSLVIGVSDEKEIVGLEPDFSAMSPDKRTKEWFQQTLVNLINEQIGSEFAPFYEVRFATHEQKLVAIVDVRERAPKPAYLKDGGTQEFYVRTSNLTKQLKNEETDRYISTHWRG
ncbi:type ISP restriction/modification enzyme [Georhizobium sp. MAB10]|uniref:type ISP restriction/modification enzyme n=1 Tax=Georhizobium sp. MAB10 TaxID=3028319 RepID=UPI00385572F4